MSIQEKLTTIAENVPLVYEAGVAEGEFQYRQRWWENFCNTAAAQDYLFYGKGWNDTTFNPYGVVIKACKNYMFSDNTITNIPQKLIDGGASIDWSTTSTLLATFQACSSSVLPDVDLSTITSLTRTFRSAQKATRLHIYNVRADCTFDTPFLYLYEMRDFEMTGTIGQNGFNMPHSKVLSKASITNIINCLSTTTSGLSVTISKTAVNKAFATTEGGTDGSTSAEWQALIATRSNWTISLADS